MSTDKNTTDQKSKSIIDYPKNHSSDNIPQLRFPEFKGEWEKKKLGEVFSIFNGYAFPSNESVEDGALWVKIADVGIQEMKKDNLSFLPIDFKLKYFKFLLEKGDYVVALTRPILGGRLKIAQIDDFFNGSLLNQRVGKIETTNSITFVYCYLQKDELIKSIENNIAGSDPPNLSPSEINSIELIIPTLPEQTKIAEFFTAIDAKIQALKNKKEKLQQYKKGVMQQLFSNYDENEGYENYDEINKKSKSIKVYQKNHSSRLRFTDENGKPFPNWEMKKLGEVGTFYAGGDLDKLDYNKIQDEKYCYPIYANGAGEGIYGYATTFQYNTNCVTVSGRGNLGFANARTQKFNAIVRLIVIEPKEFINPKFLEEIINQTRFSIESTGVPQLTVPQISSYKIPIPSLPEQTKIANFLSSIDEKINHTETQIQQTQTWKKGLLQQMFV